MNFNDEDISIPQKSKNYFKKDLKWKNNEVNLISIHNYILKSLPYYNEKNFNLINANNNKNNNSFLNNANIKRHIYFRHYSRKLSRKLIGNSSKMVLQNIHRKLSSRNLNENESSNKRKIFRKSNTIFNLDDFTKSLKNQKSPDLCEDNFSILQKKNFFRKKVNIKDNKRGAVNLRESLLLKIYENNKEKEDMDEDLQYEDVYFELIRFIMEGKNKAFEKLFEKKKKFIDINQELFDKNTLLILCVKEGNYFITKFLCEQGAEVNLQNNNGNTALHYALGKQFYTIADILTRHGAREDIKNKNGLIPWDCIENNIE